MFDLDKILNDIIYSKTVSSIVGNPVYVSIIIVTIILIIILFMFKESDDSDSEDEDDDKDKRSSDFWKKMVKVGVYMLIPVLSIIVIHYKNLEKEMENRYENKATERIVSDTLQPAVTASSEIVSQLPPPSLGNEGFSGASAAN